MASEAGGRARGDTPRTAARAPAIASASILKTKDVTMTLPYRLDRLITIQAPRELVCSFFTESARWAAWWGEG